MSKTTSSSLLDSFSQISAQSRCDNCFARLDRVSWMQCDVCKIFDLCHVCMRHGALQTTTINSHNATHTRLNHSEPNYKENMKEVLVGDVEINGRLIFNEMRNSRFKTIIERGKIENDLDISLVMSILHSDEKLNVDRSKMNSMIVDYHLEAFKRKIHVLSLDGGGVRGYMSIQVLRQLIKDKYIPEIEPFNEENTEHRKQFLAAQLKFADQFDYFVGTSTGGLIALCLATKYPILEIQKIYKKPNDYFIKNWMPWLFGTLGDLVSAKYSHTKIHDEIDAVINKIFEGKFYNDTPITSKNATLLDLHNLLNPDHIVNDEAFELNHQYHGNLLEFTDDQHARSDCIKAHQGDRAHCVKRERVLLINAFDTTASSVTVFNSSYAEHWNYLIADVMKSTMAAPTYFQPWTVEKGKRTNGEFHKQGDPHVFIDGGVYANDPELTALWAIRMQWKKMVNYHLLCVGTGCYSPQLSSDSWGGYYTWLFQKGKSGMITGTLMDATRSLTETITNNLTKLDNIKRMKFNYKLAQSVSLDDADFPKKFDEEWEKLKSGSDYKALGYFYDAYIIEEKNDNIDRKESQ